MLYARDTQSTAQTDTELIAAPGAGKTIEVLSLVFTTGAAMLLTVEDGTTAMFAHDMAANTAVSVPSGSVPMFAVTANTALTYTTSASGATFITVAYRVMDA